MARIKKIMSTNVQTLEKEAKVEEAAQLLVKNQSGCVVIVEGNKPIGIITELDLIRNLTSDAKDLKWNVTKIMSSPVTSKYEN